MNRNLLVLDLDETLIHANRRSFEGAELFTGEFYIAVRPGLEQFLRAVSKQYDLLVWSNNGMDYINQVLDHTWPDQSLRLVDIFSSAQCGGLVKNGQKTPYYKDLKKVAKLHPVYSIDRIVGIDNLPDIYSQCYGNLIAVESFTGKPDNELELLTTYLLSIAEAPSLRKLEKRGWRSTAHRLLRESRTQGQEPETSAS